MKFTKRMAVTAVTSLVASNAWATNGMNMEGYGSKATAMGGAGMAYDTGNSAVMNNPATLSLMQDGQARLGVGIRNLRPDVDSSVPSFGVGTESDGDSYLMPSFSYMRRDGKYSYGAAVLAQGGMGTEYGKASSPTDLFAGGMSLMGAMTPLSGDEVRSEVGVGRFMLPLSYQANDRLTIGGSVDVVWAMMDLQMDMSGAQFGQLMQGNGGEVGGSMRTAMEGAMGGGMITDVNWARFDYSDNSDFTGKAKGYGLGAKLGFTYAFTDRFRIGGAYHTKTNISDLEADNQKMYMNAVMGGAPATVALSGDYSVKDFQWPATWAIGGAFEVNEKLLLVGDIKYIEWNGVLDTFDVKFKADGSASNGGFANTTLNVSLDQDWDNQTVIQLGLQYKYNPNLALRAGLSLSDNPVPNEFVNPLFPAIIENHYMAGLGYRFNDNHGLDFSITYAPEVKAKGDGPLNTGLESTHSQFNWTLNYVYNF